MRTVSRAFLGIALALLTSSAGAARYDFDAAGGRLPKDVRPTHYRLELELDPAIDRFSGTADIEIEVRRSVEAIVLNAHRLEAGNARLVDADGTARTLAITADAQLQQWRLAVGPGASIAPGRYRIGIDYTGRVEQTGQGLFAVNYRAEGAAARMLATQLEPSHARTVFPGFDEPAFRASFQLTARAPVRYEIVSNMPATASKVVGGRRETRFAPTPSMPTYLFAVAVGEFDTLEDKHDDVQLRILTARGKRNHAMYAMETTKKLLRFYREYFGLPYMLPKLDQLAVPGVRRGAMEDWGAISYNEAVLLYDVQRSTPQTKQSIFSIVAHEIAHQWFGNLVTAAWWDDIWLNEAFATWMAQKAANHFNPDWDLQASSRMSKENAMRRDAGGATRPIVIPIRTENEVFGVFDEITYQKGGSVLSMFEASMGADTFRDGLRRYIRTHAYSNATADDLWHHLSQAAGRDVGGQIADWVTQPGFPVLDLGTRCAGERTEVSITQQRFSSTGLRESVATWHVPVMLRAGGETRAFTMGRDPLKITFAGCGPIVANAGDAGYYRVRYDKEAAARIREVLGKLTSLDRAAITADTFALASNGTLPVVDYLALISVPVSRTPNEWRQIVESLTRLDAALVGTPAQAALREWARNQLSPELERLGWASSSQEELSTLRLRAELIDALGQFDHAPTIRRARDLHAAGTSDPSIIVGVVNTVARHADAATFEALLAARKSATAQEEMHRLENALSLPRDPTLVKRVLELSLTSEWDSRAATWLATNVGPNSGNTALGYEFVERRYAALAAKASDWGRPWLLPQSAAGFNESVRAEAMIAAQQELVGEPGRDAAQRIAEAIREKAAIREREGTRLAEQLHKRAAGPAR